MLVAGARKVDGLLGSSVWGGRAVDRLIRVPPEALAVRRRASLRFEAPGEAPDEASVSAYRAQDLAQPAFTPVSVDDVDPAQLTYTVALEPDRYVLALFRVWRGRGDVTHYFSVQVLPEDDDAAARTRSDR